MRGVAQVAGVVIPHPAQGEVGAAFVVPSSAAELDKDAVRQYASDHLARYKVPKHVFLVDSLPLNASGKVLKTVLREQAVQGN